MAFPRTLPLYPFAFKEIGFPVGKLANLGGPFAVLAVEGAGYEILSSGQGHDRNLLHEPNSRNGSV